MFLKGFMIDGEMWTDFNRSSRWLSHPLSYGEKFQAKHTWARERMQCKFQAQVEHWQEVHIPCPGECALSRPYSHWWYRQVYRLSNYTIFPATKWWETPVWQDQCMTMSRTMAHIYSLISGKLVICEREIEEEKKRLHKDGWVRRIYKKNGKCCAHDSLLQQKKKKQQQQHNMNLMS